MAEFESRGLKAGIWSGRLTADTAPARLVLVHRGQIIGQPRITPDGANAWRVEIAIPADRLDDGVTNLFLMADDGGTPQSTDIGPEAERIGVLTLATGRALDGDLGAEIALMREEIDMLKRELRSMAQGG